MPGILNRFSKLFLFLLAYSPVVIALLFRFRLSSLTVLIAIVFFILLLVIVYMMLVTVSSIESEPPGDVNGRVGRVRILL